MVAVRRLVIRHDVVALRRAAVHGWKLKKSPIRATSFETMEQFLARGGSVKQVDPVDREEYKGGTPTFPTYPNKTRGNINV